MQIGIRSGAAFASVLTLAVVLGGRATAEEFRALGLDPEHAARVTSHVEAEPELVWRVLTDLEGWARVFPDLRRVDVRSDAAGHRVVEQESQVLGMTIHARLFVEVDAADRVLRLRLAPNGSRDLETMTTVWKLTTDGSGTRIEIASQVTSGYPIPAFIARRAVSSSLRGAVDGLVAEVERRRPVAVAGRF